MLTVLYKTWGFLLSQHRQKIRLQLIWKAKLTYLPPSIIKVIQASNYLNPSKLSPLVIYSLNKYMVFFGFWARFLKNSACFNKKKFQDKNQKHLPIPYKKAWNWEWTPKVLSHYMTQICLQNSVLVLRTPPCDCWVSKSAILVGLVLNHLTIQPNSRFNHVNCGYLPMMSPRELLARHYLSLFYTSNLTSLNPRTKNDFCLEISFCCSKILHKIIKVPSP
jgi:hypothetical protein